ncbi:MAG: hypothetical protein DSM106950_25115 [Stigonema ocellatum SAG 48.90 = DSM 106950]|nr:hypothetical protein [Stigonema ocellatum SAG 48.90 = DSM 106950]
MKQFITGTLLVLASIVGFTPISAAEQPVQVTTDGSDVYMIDLDNRTQYYTDAEWRHVSFRVSTIGDKYWHSAIAACSPYQVKAPFYQCPWIANGGGYPEGTIGGNIARAACNW